MLFSKFIAWGLLGAASSGAVFPGDTHQCQDVDPANVRTVFQFDQVGTWLENLVVLPGGDILFTTVSPNATLYRVQNPNSEYPEVTTVATFPVTSLTGVALRARDGSSVVVLGGNFSAPAVPVPDSWSAYLVELDAPITVTRIVGFPGDVFPNGITPLPPSHGGWWEHPGERRRNDIFLVAESLQGSIIRLDVQARAADTVLSLAEMKPVPNEPPIIGINGIKAPGDGHVYWTNSHMGAVYRYPLRLDADGFFPPPPNDEALVQTVVIIPDTFLDDLFVLRDGTIYAATNPNNTVVRVAPETRDVSVVAGAQGSTLLAGATAVVPNNENQYWGPGHWGPWPHGEDAQRLYVTTNGGLVVPVNGTVSVPGKLAAIDCQEW